MHHFCTLFDINYLSRGLAMMRSLQAHLPDSHIHVLCMDTKTQDFFTALQLDYVSPIALPTLEAEEPRLEACKQARNTAEYCWTLSSVFTRYLMATVPKIDRLTYLDADLLFFSSPQVLFDEMGNRDIAIIEHRYAPHLQHLMQFGRFCVQWVSFRRSQTGLECLDTWAEQCFDWCFAYADPERYGDQKYLDAWPARYGNKLAILQNIGAGVAPWNFTQYDLSQDTEESATLLNVNQQPLVFYHFHQFKKMRFCLFSHCSYFYSQGRATPKAIYKAYEIALDEAHADVFRETGLAQVGVTPIFDVLKTRLGHFILPTGLRNKLRRLFG
jgi:hypothetical protein